ncbi:hypothetical protein FQZ97_1062020 [compost metagenome]
MPIAEVGSTDQHVTGSHVPRKVFVVSTHGQLGQRFGIACADILDTHNLIDIEIFLFEYVSHTAA